MVSLRTIKTQGNKLKLSVQTENSEIRFLLLFCFVGFVLFFVLFCLFACFAFCLVFLVFLNYNEQKYSYICRGPLSLSVSVCLSVRPSVCLSVCLFVSLKGHIVVLAVCFSIISEAPVSKHGKKVNMVLTYLQWGNWRPTGRSMKSL